MYKLVLPAAATKQMYKLVLAAAAAAAWLHVRLYKDD
jgi:hypothetical protein